MYARAGRGEDARRLLRELDDRSNRGEYVPVVARLQIRVGLGDLPAIRTELSNSLCEATPPLSIQTTCGHYLGAFRGDQEIDRLHRELFGW